MLCTDFHSLVAKLWKLTRSLRSVVRFAKFCNSWIKIRTPHFLWSNLFILHGIIGELRFFSLIEMLTPFSFRQRHKLHAQSRAAPSSWVLSKFPNSMHRQLIAWSNFSIAKSQQHGSKNMFYLWLTTKEIWFALHGVGNQRIQLACLKHALIKIRKSSSNIQVLVNILAWLKWKAGRI